MNTEKIWDRNISRNKIKIIIGCAYEAEKEIVQLQREIRILVSGHIFNKNTKKADRNIILIFLVLLVQFNIFFRN